MYENLLFVAAPTNAPGERPATAIELVHVLQNHETFQTIMTQLVRGLKDALQDKQPAQFAPVLQNAIKQLGDALPKMKFRPLIRATTGIAQEAQDLINALAASSSNGVAEVNAFVEKRLHDMQNIYYSHKYIQSKLDSMVIIHLNVILLREMLGCNVFDIFMEISHKQYESE